MHHTLKLYARYREHALRFYMLGGRLTRVPLLGRLVRAVANGYGDWAHNAYVLSLEQAHRIVDASPTVVLAPCTCRHLFHNCDAPLQAEVLVGEGKEIFAEDDSGRYQEVSKETAKELLTAFRERNLLQTLIRCRQGFYAICNCCRCCCVPLRLRREYGVGAALVRSGDIVEVFARSVSAET